MLRLQEWYNVLTKMKSKVPLDVEALVSSLESGDPCAYATAASNVRTFVSWKAPDSSSAAKRTLLHIAAAKGSSAAVAALLQLGADANAVGDDGATPMHCACQGLAPPDGLSEVISILLASGAQKEARDQLGRRPLDLLLAHVRGACAWGGGELRRADAALGAVVSGARISGSAAPALACMCRRPPDAALPT